MEYLTHLSRGLPDRWVCGECVKLHQIKERDIPSKHTDHYPKCEKERRESGTYSGMHKTFGPYDFCPSYRHVQLTLKYTRLDDSAKKWRHRRYLQKLIAPRHSRMKSLYDRDEDISIQPLAYLESFGIHENIIARVPDYAKTVDIDIGISGRHSACPKVVDGRYLLFSTWIYREGRTEVSRRSIRRIYICPHIGSHEQKNSLQKEKRFIDMALDEAFSATNTEVVRSCHSCRTDYSIKASPDRVIICAWQDFGSEGMIWDRDWMAIAWSVIVRSSRTQIVSVSHRPGSVRELYGTVNMSKYAIH
jgi:hypothetical protein